MLLSEFKLDLSRFLPLKIEDIKVEDYKISIKGDNWSFHTESSWRIITSKKYELGLYDNEVSEFVQELNGLLIIGIESQTRSLSIDPVFILSNDYKIEVFSDIAVDSWTFQSPSGKVFVASPSDKKQLLNN